MNASRTFAVALVALALSLPSARAAAFCGFFVAGSDAKLTNNASQVVLMREGNRTVMTMSNNYQGPARELRDGGAGAGRVAQGGRQDAARRRVRPPRFTVGAAARRVLGAGSLLQSAAMLDGAVGGALRIGARWRSAHEGDDGKLGVRVEARFVVGEYEIVDPVGDATSRGLETWLHQNNYNIPRGAAAALAPVRARPDGSSSSRRSTSPACSATRAARVQLSPLRFAFDANELRLPVRLGLLNAGGKQDLIVYILHPTSRFEVANYPNVFIPTNLDVADGVRQSFPAFYAELFDATIEQDGAQGGRHRVRLADDLVRSLPDASALAERSVDARARRDRRNRHGFRCRGDPWEPGGDRDWPPRRLLRDVGGLGADPAPHTLQQGDVVRGPRVPRGQAGHRRARELERHQR